MKKLTKKDAIRLFRKHWRWLAKTGKLKEDCPPEEVEGRELSNIKLACFLCEYDERAGFYCGDKCLIKWPPDDKGCLGYLKTPYRSWSKVKAPKTRKKWAAIIAELPAR